MKLTRLMVALSVGLCGVARGEVTHFTFPVPGHPNWGQAIQHKVYELNQKTPKRIAWGIGAPAKVRYMGRPRTAGTLYNEASLPLGPFESK